MTTSLNITLEEDEAYKFTERYLMLYRIKEKMRDMDIEEIVIGTNNSHILTFDEIRKTSAILRLLAEKN